jgi:hypothetical protein
VNKDSSKRSNARLGWFRIISALLMHGFFWSGIALMKVNYLKFFTSWAIFLSMMTFTLAMIAHIRELSQQRRLEGKDSAGIDTSDYDSTFLGQL